jgi:hypothetical protein
MQLNLEFDNNGNTFDYLSNTQNNLESNYLQISIGVMDIILKNIGIVLNV